uniref:EamA domain-containing protein n=1 Tax=Chromera velia CCMP2878 TaxID=1169474 RepID=A0A0G4IAL8_9ALVE|eukprot:Cvel_2100.t1-p1 / transcript=Cvel_2100.t1 / gene=Cvel_2100 / organism=Chromera_velia_CCMP2878 / gene_product=Solute carrier family 35 member G1, putative / transcript_product=Solute carrier family 35 member G1, putative / location=Cvel_scaffold81:36148-38751(-) / protein_length=539 / sequence_SO=supercontig / SO=protein_coding / is_pseudo=false
MALPADHLTATHGTVNPSAKPCRSTYTGPPDMEPEVSETCRGRRALSERRCEACGTGGGMRPFMGLFFCALSAFCFSLVSLTVRLASQLWEVLQIVWYRAVIQVVVGVGTLGVRSLKVRKFPGVSDVVGPRPLMLFVLGRGVFGALCNGLQFFVLTQMPIGEASAVFLTSPLFTALIAWRWLGERWGKFDSLAAALMLLGTFLLAQPETVFPPESRIFLFGPGERDKPETETENERETASPVVVSRGIAVLLGVLAAFFSGITLNMIRRAKDVDPLCFSLSFSLSSLVLSSVAMPVFSPLSPDSAAMRAAASSLSSLARFWSLWGWITLVGLCGFGAHWFQVLGMKFERAGLVAFVRRTDVIWAFIFQVFVLRQAVTLFSLLGALLVVAGVCVIAGHKLMSEKRKRRKEALNETPHTAAVSFPEPDSESSKETPENEEAEDKKGKTPCGESAQWGTLGHTSCSRLAPLPVPCLSSESDPLETSHAECPTFENRTADEPPMKGGELVAPSFQRSMHDISKLGDTDLKPNPRQCMDTSFEG